MISIKKHMSGSAPVTEAPRATEARGLLPSLLTAYGSAMLAMGGSTYEACPSLGDELKRRFRDLSARLSLDMGPEALEAIDREIEGQVQDWGQRAARYHRERAAEVKTLLLAMARTAESVGSRDERYATQVGLVTARLRQIATLDHVAQIRASVEQGAADLKSSIERMTAEGQAAVAELRQQVQTYQVRLEDVTEQASRDALTGVRNRSSIEKLIEERMASRSEFCVGVLDLDRFKQVNDTHGHLVGDELLRMFAGELRSACRSTDVIGRWGGDEFILLFDCSLADATARADRLSEWVCGDYEVRSENRTVRLQVKVSVGLAAHRRGESLQSLVARSDAAMYERKAAAKGGPRLHVVHNA